MKTSDWISDRLGELEDDLDYNTHRVIIQTAHAISKRMSELGMTKADLAHSLGVSRPFVTKLLTGNPNMTIRTLVSLALATKTKVHVDFRPHASVDEWLALTSCAPANVYSFAKRRWEPESSVEIALNNEDEVNAEVASGA